jgi:hypothetical protein
MLERALRGIDGRLYDAYLVRHSLRAHSASRLLCKVSLAVQRGETRQEGL